MSKSRNERAANKLGRLNHILEESSFNSSSTNPEGTFTGKNETTLNALEITPYGGYNSNQLYGDETLMRNDNTFVKLHEEEDDTVAEELKSSPTNHQAQLGKISAREPDVVEGGLIRSVRGHKGKVFGFH